MSKQTIKQGSTQANELTANLTEFMRRTESLVGTRTSFRAEFSMRSEKDANYCYQTQADFALSMFSHYLRDHVISCALSVPTGEAVPVKPDHGVGPGRRSDLAILPSPLDDANYGDEERFDIVTHFYEVASRAMNFQDLSRTFVQVTDRLTAAPFHTSEYTGLTTRVLLEDHLAPAHPLAFALHCKDARWMDRGGRENGRISAENNWSLRSFRDMIIWQFLEQDHGLDRTSSRSSWAKHLTDVALTIIEEGLDVANNLDQSCRHADFRHVGGHAYTRDFASNLEIMQEMALALKASSCSDPDEYWKQPVNARLLQGIIDEILEVERISAGISYEPVESVFYAAFKIMYDGQAWGKATDWNRSPGASEAPMNGSTVNVGDYADSTMTDGEAAFMAASMIRRRMAG